MPTYEIHPAIGIARLGDSTTGYFVGPEPAIDEAAYAASVRLPGIARVPPLASYRDSSGRLLRQAARFRVFEVERDANGGLTKAAELKDGTPIQWSVHLANRKGNAIRFMDRNKPPSQQILRNAGSQNTVIDGKLQIVTHTSTPGQEIGGTFMNQAVKLGNAWVEKGRLHVLGGHGTSGSVPTGKPLSDGSDFADNNFWYDDTSDGPIFAKVTLANGTVVEAAPAWVIAAPFDFAPELDSYVTLYEVAYQAAIDRQEPGYVLPPAGATSFRRDVLPILDRVRGYRWVNGGGLRAETQDRHARWAKPEFILMLADPADTDRGLRWRNQMLAHLPVPPDLPNPPPAPEPRQVLMPRLRDPDSGGAGSNAVLALMPYQYKHFWNWAEGHFTADAAPPLEFPCEALDRIGLQTCSGGAFFPGIEAPRIMRNKHIYAKPFRLKVKPGGDPTAPSPVPAPSGSAIFAGLVPGQVTEGLVVPWQSDFFLCQQGRDNAWWPASRPDHVFHRNHPPPVVVDSQADYTVRWDDNVASMEAMVIEWCKLGIVQRVEACPTATLPVKELEARAYDVEVGVSGVKHYYYFQESERTLADSAHRTDHFPE